MSLSYRKKLVVSKIENLSSTEHGEIFKILETRGIPFSKNKNGCFFNMNAVDVDIICEIERFVEYCNDNKQHIDDYNKQLNECKLRGTLKPQQQPPPRESDDNNVVGEDEGEVMVVGDDEVFDDDEIVDEDDDDGLSVLVEQQQQQQQLQSVVQTDSMRKKSTSKFVIAKKRFAKRCINDQRIEFDASEVLCIPS